MNLSLQGCYSGLNKVAKMKSLERLLPAIFALMLVLFHGRLTVRNHLLHENQRNNLIQL